MKEFMLLISAEGDPIARLTRDEQQKHVQRVGAYIQKLIESGHMKDAQPLEMIGTKVRKNGKGLVDGPFNESKEVITGFYHILAKDLEEATQIAKQDPRFEDGDWRIEVRPIMKVEGIN